MSLFPPCGPRTPCWSQQKLVSGSFWPSPLSLCTHLVFCYGFLSSSPLPPDCGSIFSASIMDQPPEGYMSLACVSWSTIPPPSCDGPSRCQIGCVRSHLGDTLPPVSMRAFPEKLIEDKAYPESGLHHPVGWGGGLRVN